VYFETSTSSPYQIRRIEELNKVRIDTFLHFSGEGEESQLFILYLYYSVVSFKCVNLFNMQICIDATMIKIQYIR